MTFKVFSTLYEKDPSAQYRSVAADRFPGPWRHSGDRRCWFAGAARRRVDRPGAYKGIPDFISTLRIVLSEMQVESHVLAEEILLKQPPALAQLNVLSEQAALGERRLLSHEAFKQLQSPGARGCAHRRMPALLQYRAGVRRNVLEFPNDKECFMQRGLPILRNLFRSVLLLSALTAASAHAAEKIDLIIDTDPGADDVVALLFAMASPDELNIRALTTVAGNVRLDKTSRNARLARESGGREEHSGLRRCTSADAAQTDLCRKHPWQGGHFRRHRA